MFIIIVETVTILVDNQININPNEYILNIKRHSPVS